MAGRTDATPQGRASSTEPFREIHIALVHVISGTSAGGINGVLAPHIDQFHKAVNGPPFLRCRPLPVISLS
jgi:hypothetical protein